MNDQANDMKILPSGWVNVSLDKIANIVYGKNLPTKSFVNEGYPVFGANGIIGFYKTYRYEDEQVLISCRGANSGTINFSPPKCFITNNSLVLEVPDKLKSDRRYLYYVLQSVDKSKLVTGSAQPQVTINNARVLNLPLPPLPEQHRIVNKIEELFTQLDAGFDLLLKTKVLLNQYRQSVLKAAFEGELTEEWRNVHGVKDSPDDRDLSPNLPKGWKWVRVQDLCADIFDGPFGSNLKTADYVDRGVRVIRLENIGFLEFIGTKESYISQNKYEALKKHTVRAGDVVFSSFISGNTRVAIVPRLKTDAVNKADCFCLRTSAKVVSNKWLAYSLSSSQVFHRLKLLTHGATRPRVNTTQLRNLLLPTPPLQEQHQIAESLDLHFSLIDSLTRDVTEGSASISNLRNSILTKAFQGKLVPQNPADEPASKLLERITTERSGEAPRGRNPRQKKMF